MQRLTLPAFFYFVETWTVLYVSQISENLNFFLVWFLTVPSGLGWRKSELLSLSFRAFSHCSFSFGVAVFPCSCFSNLAVTASNCSCKNFGVTISQLCVGVLFRKAIISVSSNSSDCVFFASCSWRWFNMDLLAIASEASFIFIATSLSLRASAACSFARSSLFSEIYKMAKCQICIAHLPRHALLDVKRDQTW